MGNDLVACCKNKLYMVQNIQIIEPKQVEEEQKNENASIGFTRSPTQISFVFRNKVKPKKFSIDMDLKVISKINHYNTEIKSRSVQGVKYSLMERIKILENHLSQIPRKLKGNIMNVVTGDSNFTRECTHQLLSNSDEVLSHQDTTPLVVINKPLEGYQIDFLRRILFNEELLLKEMSEAIM